MWPQWCMGGGMRMKLAHYAGRNQRKDWTQRSGTIGSLTTAGQRWIKVMTMPACGEWFAKTNPHEELCFKCECALYRLSNYVARVTRCKDCAHYDLGVCLKIYSDGNAQKDPWQSRNPDDFCSYGERKGNNPGLFTMEARNEKFAKI